MDRRGWLRHREAACRAEGDSTGPPHGIAAVWQQRRGL
jgi:hypothetical protein